VADFHASKTRKNRAIEADALTARAASWEGVRIEEVVTVSE